MAITIPQIGEIDTAALARAILTLAPLVAVAAASGDPNWLLAAIVTISAYIAMDRSGLAPLGVVFHGVAIAGGFMALLAALSTPPLFVLGCAGMAAASVLLAGRGSKLQSLGIFTFVPALYLACEIGEGTATHEFVRHGVAFLPFLVVAMSPVLLMSAFDHLYARDAEVDHLRHFSRILRWSELGVRSFYGEAAIAAALSVAVAATAVEWLHLDHGQWVIWSAASVVTGDAASGHRKLLDRMTGAVVGVPVGVAIGLLARKICWPMAALPPAWPRSWPSCRSWRCAGMSSPLAYAAVALPLSCCLQASPPRSPRTGGQCHSWRCYRDTVRCDHARHLRAIKSRRVDPNNIETLV